MSYACTYACLILHDEGIPITVESYWPSLFAKLCEKKNVDELIMNVGSGGAAASTGAVAAAAPTTDHVAPAEADKKKEEKKEESDDEAMFSLFD